MSPANRRLVRAQKVPLVKKKAPLLWREKSRGKHPDDVATFVFRCLFTTPTTTTRPLPRVILRDARRLPFLSLSSRRTTLVHWLVVFGAASYDDPLLEFYGPTDDVCTVRSLTLGSKSIALRNEILESSGRR